MEQKQIEIKGLYFPVQDIPDTHPNTGGVLIISGKLPQPIREHLFIDFTVRETLQINAKDEGREIGTYADAQIIEVDAVLLRPSEFDVFKIRYKKFNRRSCHITTVNPKNKKWNRTRY